MAGADSKWAPPSNQPVKLRYRSPAISSGLPLRSLEQPLVRLDELLLRIDGVSAKHKLFPLTCEATHLLAYSLALSIMTMPLIMVVTTCCDVIIYHTKPIVTSISSKNGLHPVPSDCTQLFRLAKGCQLRDEILVGWLVGTYSLSSIPSSENWRQKAPTIAARPL